MSAAEARTPGAWWRARTSSLRRRHYLAIGVGLVVFLAVSVLLARFLSTENAERSQIVAVLQAQADGRPRAMLAHLHDCRLACRANVRRDAVRLRRDGPVKILLLQSATAYSLTPATGHTRVAWTVIGRLPVVQCFVVRRSGNFLTGVSVRLQSLGPQIPGEADC